MKDKGSALGREIWAGTLKEKQKREQGLAYGALKKRDKRKRATVGN